jgi:periplasmic protein TonB
MRLLPRTRIFPEGRKAKISGLVLLDVTVTTDGRVTKPVVLKGRGMGLDEKALEAVRNWKMKPASGPGWQTFRLPGSGRGHFSHRLRRP